MVPKPPVGLAARGKRMWTDTLAGTDLGPAHRVLLEEACRMADRLEALDKAIRARGVDFATIAPLLAESRLQSQALRQLLNEIRQGARTQPASPQEGGAGVASIADQVAKRRAKAKG